jgi:hypothetical protein
VTFESELQLIRKLRAQIAERAAKVARQEAAEAMETTP